LRGGVCDPLYAGAPLVMRRLVGNAVRNDNVPKSETPRGPRLLEVLAIKLCATELHRKNIELSEANKEAGAGAYRLVTARDSLLIPN